MDKVEEKEKKATICPLYFFLLLPIIIFSFFFLRCDGLVPFHLE